MESRYAITPHPAAAHQQYLKHTASSQRTSSPTSSPPHNGLSTSSTVEVQQVPPRPLSAIAQQAYDRYGVIDHARLDLMVRGIFITREDAARLPHRITPDGCPDVRTGVSHHQRASMGGISTAPAPRPAGGGGDNPEGASAAATAAAVRAAAAKPRAPSSARASPSARATGVSAVPSSHEKWTEGEVRLLIGLRAENVGFRFIAVGHFLLLSLSLSLSRALYYRDFWREETNAMTVHRTDSPARTRRPSRRSSTSLSRTRGTPAGGSCTRICVASTTAPFPAPFPAPQRTPSRSRTRRPPSCRLPRTRARR